MQQHFSAKQTRMFRLGRRLSASAATATATAAATTAATVRTSSCYSPPPDIVMDHMYEDDNVDGIGGDDDDEPTRHQRYLPLDLTIDTNNAPSSSATGDNASNADNVVDPYIDDAYPTTAATAAAAASSLTASSISLTTIPTSPRGRGSSSSSSSSSPQRQQRFVRAPSPIPALMNLKQQQHHHQQSSSDKDPSTSQDSSNTPKKMKTIDDTEKTTKSSSSGGGKSSTLTAANADDSSQVAVMKKKLAKVEKTLAKHGKGHPDYAKLCQKREHYQSSLAKLTDVASTNDKSKTKESGGSAVDSKDTSNNGSTASSSKGQKSTSKKKHHHHSKKSDGHRRGDHSHSHTHSGRTITATSSRKARTAATAAEDTTINNGHESFATNLSTDTRATVPETPFHGSVSGIGVVGGAEGDDDSILLLNSPKRTSSIASSPVRRTLPGGPPLASPYSNQRTPLVLAQEDDEVEEENEDEDIDQPLFCKLYQKVAVTSLSNGSSSLVHDIHTPQRFLNIGFVRLPSRLESTFKDAREVMEDELVPDVIDFEFKFVIPSLGPVAQKQEALFGPLLSQDHQHNTSSGNGNGSERSYNTLTSHTHRSNATQRTAMTAGTMSPAAVLGSLENPLQLVIVNCGPRKVVKPPHSAATGADGNSEEVVSAGTDDKDMSVTGHDKKEVSAPSTSLNCIVSEDENGSDENVDNDEEESMDRGWRIIKQTGSISHRSRLSTSIPHTISGRAEDYEDGTNVQLPPSPITSPSASLRKSAKEPEGGNDSDHSSASFKKSPISRNNSQDSHDLDTPLLDSLLAGVDSDNKDPDGNNMSSLDGENDDNATNISVIQSTSDDSKRGVMELLKNLQARAVDAGIVAPVDDMVDEQPSPSDPPAQTTQNNSASNRVTFNTEAGSEHLKAEEAQAKKGQLDMYLGSKVDDLSDGDGGDTEIFSVSCDARAWLQYKKEKKLLHQDEDSDDSDEEDEDEEDDGSSYDDDEARRWISTKAVIHKIDDEDEGKDQKEEDSDESKKEVETEAVAKAEDLTRQIEEAVSANKAAVVSSTSNVVEEVDPIFEPSGPSSDAHDEVEDLSETESVQAEDGLIDETENDDEDLEDTTEEAGLPPSSVEIDENEGIQVTTEESDEPEMETADESESSDDEIIEVVAHKPKLLMLVTLYTGNREIMPKQKRAQMMLESCGLEPVMIDGSDPEMREKRNSLFDIAGEGSRGQYPLFFKEVGRSCHYIGNFDSLEDMEEQGTLGNILSD